MWMHVFLLSSFEVKLGISQLNFAVSNFVTLINTAGFYLHTLQVARSKRSSWTNFVK